MNCPLVSFDLLVFVMGSIILGVHLTLAYLYFDGVWERHKLGRCLLDACAEDYGIAYEEVQRIKEENELLASEADAKLWRGIRIVEHGKPVRFEDGGNYGLARDRSDTQ